MLVELLRPAGPELARRWLAALLLAPVEEREAIVRSVEERMVGLYAEGGSRGSPLSLHTPPVAREGHTEQTVRTYERVEGRAPMRAKAKKRGA